MLPFLHSLAFQVNANISSQSRTVNMSHKLEHEMVNSALAALNYNSIVTSTLNWILHARQYSPFVHMHYSIGNETIAAFQKGGLPLLSDHDVFAVEVDHAKSHAKLLLNPTDFHDCEHCAKAEAYRTSDYLSFSLKLPREISLSQSCTLDESVPTVLIYANLFSPRLDSWLKAIGALVKKCQHRVALRFWYPSHEKSDDSDRPGLQGFTVTTALKSTEYTVIDDRAFVTKLFDDCPYGEKNCSIPAASAIEDPLAWSEADGNAWKPPTYTGIKVLSYLRDTAEGDIDRAIDVLQSFTEDTPSVTRSKQFQGHPDFEDVERKAVAKGVKELRSSIGDNDYLFINSRPFDLQTVMQDSERFFRCLSTISVSSMAFPVVREKVVGETDNKQSSSVGHSKGSLRVDLHMAENLPKSLVWFNDMSKDSRYKNWQPLDSTNVSDIAAFRELIKKGKGKREPHMQLAKVRAHVVSLVVLVDAGDSQQFMYTSIPESVVVSDLPIRVGMVLIPNGHVSSLVAASFHYFLRSKGRRSSVKFLQMVRQVLEYVGGGYQQVGLSEQIVELAFQQMVADGDSGYVSAANLLNQDEEIQGILNEARMFAEERRLFTDKSPEDVHDEKDVSREFSMLGLLNGLVLQDISADAITFSLSEQERVAKLLEADFSVAADDSVPDFERWVASDPNLIVVEGLSQEMRSGDQRLSRFKTEDDLKRLSASSVLSLREELNSISYLASPENFEDNSFGITVWLASKDTTSSLFKKIAGFFEQLASSDFAQRTRSRFGILDEKTMLHARILESSPHQVLCVMNGRIFSPSTLHSIEELKVEIASEYNADFDTNISNDERLLLGMFQVEISSSCATNTAAARATQPQLQYEEVVEAVQSSNISQLLIETGSSQGQEASQLEIYAVINPLGSNAFVASALFAALRQSYSSDTVAMTLVLTTTNPELRKHIDPPSTYWKFVLGAESRFHGKSGKRLPSRASFVRLPEKNVSTFGVEPPRAWFVASHATNHDMDNVVLNSLPNSVGVLNAEYELKNLIVEGSCVDEEEAPPQGLKLILENDAGVVVDTLVMANLGYFQLKVPTPGRWSLRLAVGPSSTIFSLKAMEMYSGMIRTVYKADTRGRVPILVESLSGAGGIVLRVERNAGMSGMSVLNPNSTVQAPSKKGVGEKLKATFSRLYNKRNVESDTESSKKIHVFSVSSGHLYERFTKIMMSSATKHASRPIKFWLLENYLSPSFKKMLPHFAKRLGCEVGMVTYKWPGWLRAQTEKQRIIWAYKILFLDVLFPLDVERIIFVDADQVLRGDLAELMDINLQGAPYGYVPFCDSREEVEGYRFWKTGFWKETLKDQKYRISALYVVDLVRFRETASGDTLRLIYQSLSADPNSLSNLDQDLPNYASVASMGSAKSVPIFNLPAEWLWCESWCDDESKKSAKAIDLCNNPMTKEPKLNSAKRIISEWVDYDDAATELTEQIYLDLADSEYIPIDAANNVQIVAEARCKDADCNIEEKIEL